MKEKTLRILIILIYEPLGIAYSETQIYHNTVQFCLSMVSYSHFI